MLCTSPFYRFLSLLTAVFTLTFAWYGTSQASTPAKQPASKPVVKAPAKVAPAPKAKAPAKAAPAPKAKAPAKAAPAPKAKAAAPKSKDSAKPLVKQAMAVFVKGKRQKKDISKVFRYEMLFQAQKMGSFVRTEKKLADGSFEVTNQSSIRMKVLFSTVKANNEGRFTYDAKGKLKTFKVTTKVGGKTILVEGVQDQKGIKISRKTKKKKESRFFPIGSYQGTSLDLRFPIATPGTRMHRHYLVIPRMMIVEQTMTFREVLPQVVLGKKQPLLAIEIHNKKGRSTILATQNGRMIASRTHGPRGVVIVRLVEPKQPKSPKIRKIAGSSK